MDQRWFSTENKDTWSLIYLVNYIFEMHDIFIGSHIAQRAVFFAKKIILSTLENRRDNLNQEQSSEFNSLLNCDAIKGSKVLLEFENSTKEVVRLFREQRIDSKIQGLRELQKLFGQCYNLED
mmetsp:Transcript_15343/g.23629  ORF Transcript_15343/g.23629 Transcript_15343/m.23629 type:complete len:123 (+) Transcript_15343:451-819(+)